MRFRILKKIKNRKSELESSNLIASFLVGKLAEKREKARLASQKFTRSLLLDDIRIRLGLDPATGRPAARGSTVSQTIERKANNAT